MPLLDTTPEIRRRQLAVYAAMSPEQRIEAAIGMSEEVRAIALDGIRSRNASADPAEVRREWLRILYGQHLGDRLADHRPLR